MNILLIISPYKPAQTPNTIRWAPLVDEFIKAGHDISILTTRWNALPDDENHEIKVYRAGHHTLLDGVNNIFDKKSRRNTERRVQSKTTLLSKMFQKITDVFWRKQYWPDGSTLFLRPGKMKAEKIVLKNAITHIITVGLPFTCHLIGRHIKSKYSNIHWLMDIQDPFSYSKEFRVNNFVKYETRNLKEEQSAFERASTIVNTNIVAHNNYVSLFREHKKKMHVVPPLLDVQQEDSKLTLDASKIHFGYFGSFYEGVRSPQDFLKLINILSGQENFDLDECCFHHFGEPNNFTDTFFNKYNFSKSNLQRHGLISRPKAIDAMSKMNFLINIGNTTDYHLPSKVVDFLYLNKPLINIISIDNDSTKRFLEDKIEMCNIHLDKASAKEAKEILIKFVTKERSAKKINDEKVKDYLPKKIAQKYMELMGIN